MDTVVQLLGAPVGLAVGVGLRPVANRYLARLAEHGIHAVRLGWLALPLTTGAAYLAGAFEFGASWALVPLAIGYAALAAVSWVDLRAYRIPDRIVFPALSAVLVSAGLIDLLDDGSGSFGRSVAVGGIFCGTLLLVHLVSPAGMGFGDVKLALLMGALIGWVAGDLWEAIRAVLTAVLVASVLGVALGLGLAAVRRLTGRDLLPDPDPPDLQRSASQTRLGTTAFPFGPALAVGTVVATLVHHSGQA